MLTLLPEVGLVSVGVTILMICGEFDISVGPMFAFMSIVVSLLIIADIPVFPAILAGLAIAAAVGFLNGFVTLTFNNPSFITTLGMLFMPRSLTVVVSGGSPPLLPDDLATGVFTQALGPSGLFRASFIWFAVLASAAGLLLSGANLANWIKATGGQPDAARSMAVPARRVKIFCFVLCSMLAGFAGTIQAFRLELPMPSPGEGMELQAIAAAVIGGSALSGGTGTVFGAIVGALLIRAIDNGLVVAQVNADWFKFAVGLLTVLAVSTDTWLRRTAHRIRAE